MSITKNPWIINRDLTLQEMEVLLVLCNFAGLRDYSVDFYGSTQKYKRIAFNGTYVYRALIDSHINGRATISYETAVEKLQKVISHKKVDYKQ